MWRRLQHWFYMKLLDKDVLFEDNHLLAVNKPEGLLTQPNGTSEMSLELLAKEYIKEKYKKPGNVFLHAVHRLDKPVSGIVLFAKTQKALSRLNEMMRNREGEKIYLAKVEHDLPPGFILEHKLSHDEYKAVEDSSGKLCRLLYKKISDGLYEITLETGRYHQIRAQLSLAKSPIVGDTKYGGKAADRLYLHHTRFSFNHPVGGHKVEILSSSPF